MKEKNKGQGSRRTRFKGYSAIKDERTRDKGTRARARLGLSGYSENDTTKDKG